MRGGPLSHPDVINKLNRDFVCFYFIVPDQAFPDDVPALRVFAEAYRDWPQCHVTFGVTAVTDPNGKCLLGFLPPPHAPNGLFASYEPGPFVSYLGTCLERACRLSRLEALPDAPQVRDDLATLQAEGRRWSREQHDPPDYRSLVEAQRTGFGSYFKFFGPPMAALMNDASQSADFRRKAAWTLGQITEQPWDEDDPRLLETASAYWREHGHEPQYYPTKKP